VLVQVFAIKIFFKLFRSRRKKFSGKGKRTISPNTHPSFIGIEGDGLKLSAFRAIHIVVAAARRSCFADFYHPPHPFSYDPYHSLFEVCHLFLQLGLFENKKATFILGNARFLSIDGVRETGIELLANRFNFR